jgi:uncharacterized membrane protein
MTRKLFRNFNRKITSEAFDAQSGQVVSWLVSILVLILGFLKLTSFQLTEVQLFFGILLLLAVVLLGVILGLLLPVAQTVSQLHLDKKQQA